MHIEGLHGERIEIERVGSANAAHPVASDTDVLISVRVECRDSDELELTLRSIDRAGHLAIEGFVGVRASSHRALLTFSPIEIDPTGAPDSDSHSRDHAESGARAIAG